MINKVTVELVTDSEFALTEGEVGSMVDAAAMAAEGHESIEVLSAVGSVGQRVGR